MKYKKGQNADRTMIAETRSVKDWGKQATSMWNYKIIKDNQKFKLILSLFQEAMEVNICYTWLKCLISKDCLGILQKVVNTFSLLVDL